MSELTPLTKRQQRVLDRIVKYQARHGFPPSLRDLCKSLRIGSTNGIVCHLDALETKGYIARQANESRAIRLLCRADVEAVYESQLKNAKVIA